MSQQGQQNPPVQTTCRCMDRETCSHKGQSPMVQPGQQQQQGAGQQGIDQHAGHGHQQQQQYGMFGEQSQPGKQSQPGQQQQGHEAGAYGTFGSGSQPQPQSHSQPQPPLFENQPGQSGKASTAQYSDLQPSGSGAGSHVAGDDMKFNKERGAMRDNTASESVGAEGKQGGSEFAQPAQSSATFMGK